MKKIIDGHLYDTAKAYALATHMIDEYVMETAYRTKRSEYFIHHLDPQNEYITPTTAIGVELWAETHNIPVDVNESATTHVSIRMPSRIMKVIDAQRGDMSRADYIIRLLDEKMTTL